MSRFESMLSDIQSISAADMYTAAKRLRVERDNNVRHWEDMANDCARQGFRPEFCIHGTYMWVDYDCACFDCEMGDDPRDLSLADFFEMVKGKKSYAIRKIQKMISERDDLIDVGASMDKVEKILLNFESIPDREHILI